MEPISDGFQGVLAELCFTGDVYRMSLTAAGTGNQLLTFSSQSVALVYHLLHKEIGGDCLPGREELEARPYNL